MAARGSEITRQDYNNIRKIVFNVLGAGGTNPSTNLPDPSFGYGQALQSSDIPLGPNQTITEIQWDRLRLDIGKAYTHQVGAPPALFDVSTSTIISFDTIYQTYLAAANDILVNRNLFAGSQKPQTPVVVSNGTKTLTNGWSDSVKQTVSVTFNSAAEARYFFNSGATINFRSSRTGGTTSPQNAAAQNNSWTNFLNNVVGTVSFGKDQFYALTSGGLAPGATPIFFFTAPAPYSNNYYRIKANCNSPTNVNGTATFISFEIEWIDATTIPLIATDLIDGTLTSVISETKSTGNLTVQSPIAYNIGELSPSGTPVNLAPQFTLTSNVEVVDEGSNLTFTLTSRNYPAGKSYQLEILGITDADLQGSTAGVKTITTAGNDTLATANYSVTIRADQLTEPTPEVITAKVTVAADGFQNGEILTKNVTISDTSKTPTPILTVSATSASTIQNEGFGSNATVTLTNTGNRVLNITNVSINKGANLTDFSADFTNLSGGPTFSATTIAAGGNKTFTVKFSGAIVGAQTAVVTVTSDGNDVVGGGPTPGATKTANITVNVITATYGLVTSPTLAYTASYATDGITAGETPLQTIQLTNQTGNATVQLGSPAVTITNQGTLIPTIVSDPSGQTIAPGASRSFQVKFSGLQAPLTQAVTISIDGGAAGTRTITATITGSASLPGIAVSTTGITGTPVQINVEDTKTFTISNNGSAQLNVTNIAVSGQNSYSTVTVTPTSLTIPKGAPSQTITVKMQRTRIGSDTATITITSNAPNPDNTKTVSVSFSSIALTPTYYAKLGSGSTVTTTSGIASGKRGENVTVYFSGAEPNADYFGYHQQASGVITGVPAGTTPQQAFEQKIGKKTSDGTGKVDYWTGSPSDELKFWDVGVSKLFAWVPVGKRDNGTQVWMDLPGGTGGTGGGTIQLEVFPNLTIAFTPTTFAYTNIEYNTGIPGQPVPTFPTVRIQASNGIQNAQVFNIVRWHGQLTTPSTGNPGVTLNAAGTFDETTTVAYSFTGNYLQLPPGIWTFSYRQVYKGVSYTSNEVTITITSAAYSLLPLDYYLQLPATVPEVSRNIPLQDSCWQDGNRFSGAGVWYRYYRSVVLTPGVTYELRAWADDEMWVEAYIPGGAMLIGGSPLTWLGGAFIRSFTMPTGQGNRVLIGWVARNVPPSNNPNNPGFFAVQIWQGGTKVWGTAQSTAAGF